MRGSVFMRKRKTLEETIQFAKDFLGDEYEIEKYKSRNIFGIRLTEEIKSELKRELENKKGDEKLKKFIENIIENNIDRYLNSKHFDMIEDFKPRKRFTIELTFYTTEKAIEIKKNSDIKSINRLINLILNDYLININGGD